MILYVFVTGTLGPVRLRRAARDSIVTTATVTLILIAAHLFTSFLALSHIPSDLSAGL